jgi:putative transposase
MPEQHWPHAPTHRLGAIGSYFVTAATHGKAHHFRAAHRLEVLHRGLLTVAKAHGWHLEAWAVFSNHYHFVGYRPADPEGGTTLPAMLRELHSKTAVWVNGLDGEPGRQVWFNYWETLLTVQVSYLTRLAYVHRNAVKHGLVQEASAYPWCSAAWFERTASRARVQSLYRLKTDRIAVDDDYQPVVDDSP